jgi:glutathione S-transferase
MSLQLYYHPLSSFCWKVLIALYENGTAFTPVNVDLGNAAERDALLQLWPIGKFPVLRDDARDVVIPESTIIIDYLDSHYPGGVRLIPTDVDRALQVRLRDRFYDLYVHLSVQAIVGDRLRPAGRRDPHGVDQARARLAGCYDIIERQMATASWAIGETFSLADCAAAPALFYADKVLSFRASHRNVADYLDRLLARPSVGRVIREAEPYFHMFPQQAAE